jgi:hypothetical protein
MAGRGGARRPKVQQFDASQMACFMEEWCRLHGNKKCLYFGPYECIGLSQATSAEGLAFNAAFLKGVLEVASDGYVTPAGMRSILVGIARNKPGLQSGQSDIQLWAGGRADVIMILLAHLRRLKKPREAEIVRKKLSEEEWATLEVLLDLLCCKSSESDCDSQGSQNSAAPTVFYSQDSQDSQDSQGSQGSKGSLGNHVHRRGSKHHLEESLSPLKDETPQKDGPPAKRASSSKTSPIKKETPEKEPQVKKEKGAKAPLVSKSFGKVKVGCFTSQSYVQFLDEQGSWKLLVAVSKKQSLEHDVLAKILLIYSLQSGLTKEAVLANRAELLNIN